MIIKIINKSNRSDKYYLESILIYYLYQKFTQKQDNFYSFIILQFIENTYGKDFKNKFLLLEGDELKNIFYQNRV